MGATSLDSKVASECQTSIGELLGIIAQAVRMIADILAAFEPLQARFVNCTSKAAELGRDVRRAALNAQIFALHAPAGATLEVLARQLGLISIEAIRQVERLGRDHQYTAEMVNNLRQRLADFQELGQVEQEVLVTESALSGKKLLDLEQAIPILIGRITRQQEAIGHSVEQTLAHVRFPVAVAEASSRSMGFFRDLAAWAGEGNPGFSSETAASHTVDLLKSNYTMESELHAHAAALRPHLEPPRSSVADSSIELFGDAETGRFIDDGSADGIAPERERPEDQRGPAVLSPGSTTTPPSTSPSAIPASSQGLGDNVELF